MTPRLAIETRNGREYLAVYFGEPSREQKISARFIDLTPAQSGLSIDDLWRLYRGGSFSVKPPIGAKEKASIIERLHGIIKTSHFEGEVANAKSLFKKLTGKDWVQ